MGDNKVEAPAPTQHDLGRYGRSRRLDHNWREEEGVFGDNA